MFIANRLLDLHPTFPSFPGEHSISSLHHGIFVPTPSPLFLWLRLRLHQGNFLREHGRPFPVPARLSSAFDTEKTARTEPGLDPYLTVSVAIVFRGRGSTVAEIEPNSSNRRVLLLDH